MSDKPIWAGYESHDRARCPKCKVFIPGFPDSSTEPEHPYQKTCEECGTTVHYNIRKAYTPEVNKGGNFRIDRR